MGRCRERSVVFQPGRDVHPDAPSPLEEGGGSAMALTLGLPSLEVLENEFLLSHSVKVPDVVAPGD